MSAGANTSGLRATANGQMVQDLAIRSEIDNMVPLPVNMDRMTIQVDAPAQYAGQYTTQSNVLDTRPTRLMRPQIAYDEEAGALYMVAPGLWAHDDRIAPPNLTYRWRRDGKGISGAVDTTYVLQPEDYGRPIQLRERGTDANGRRAHLSLAPHRPRSRLCLKPMARCVLTAMTVVPLRWSRRATMQGATAFLRQHL